MEAILFLMLPALEHQQDELLLQAEVVLHNIPVTVFLVVAVAVLLDIVQLILLVVLVFQVREMQEEINPQDQVVPVVEGEQVQKD
jgi:hypothetical protein